MVVAILSEIVEDAREVVIVDVLGITVVVSAFDELCDSRSFGSMFRRCALFGSNKIIQ